MLCAVPDAYRNGVESPTETDFIVKIFQNKAGLWFFFLQEKNWAQENTRVLVLTRTSGKALREVPLRNKKN